MTFSNYIIGFVTFPYITRVLGPSNFGLVNFALNTVDYFLLFASMGIVTIGTREIAAVKENKEKLSAQFSSLIGSNLLFTLICLIIYFGCILLIPKFNEHSDLFIVGSAKIIFTIFAVEWLFTGLENFKYITLRSLAIRITYVIAVFVFVRKPEDYFLYFTLTILTVVLNSIINFLYARRFVKISIPHLKNLRFVKQSLRLGFYAIMTSMYITFNVMYLGLVSNDEEVGYYSTAVKLYFIAVNLFSAFTSVMLPRMASLNASNKEEKANEYLQRSFILVLLLSLPIIIIGCLYTPIIIEIMSGGGYTSAILPMRILLPALFFVWLSQVIAFQGLIPLRKDNYLFIASILGGVLALLLNLFLTPSLKAVGSSIVLVCCEVTVATFYIFIVKKNHILSFPPKSIWIKYSMLAVPYLIFGYLASLVFSAYIAFISTLVSSVFYFGILYKLKLFR